MSNYTVTEEQISFYRENGFLQLPNFFSKEEVAELAGALDEAVRNRRGAAQEDEDEAGYDSKRFLRQMVNLWQDYPVVRKYTFDPETAAMARRLTGANRVRLFHDHALIKPPNRVTMATDWHQDHPYWPMDQCGALTLWIALDDVSVDNGCLQFIPGSFKVGPVVVVRLGVDKTKGLEVLGQRMNPVPDPVAMEMAAGGVTFHDGCNFHYAGENRSDQPRRAFAVIYVPDGLTYDGKEHMCTDGLGLTIGQGFEHENFPILAE